VIVLTCWLYIYALLWLAAWTLIAVVFAGWSPVVVTSDSMTPLIRSGDLVLLDDNAADLDEGTVIAFEREDQLVTHRIVDVWADGSYRTRGDANDGPDAEPIDPADVVGNGRLLVPVIGAPLVWVEQGRLPLALAWFLLTIGAIVVATTATPRFRSRTETPDGAHPERMTP
jgi:signal peptidase